MVSEFLKLSDSLRPGYVRTLGGPGLQAMPSHLLATLPEWLKELFSLVSGTPADIRDQRMMDFIPGYRLIQAHELESMQRAVKAQFGPEVGNAVPFLADYSSDYYCYAAGTVIELDHVFTGPDVVHDSDARFLETHCAFYREGVYSLDSNGFLTSDYEKSGRVGKRCNPGVPFWCE